MGPIIVLGDPGRTVAAGVTPVPGTAPGPLPSTIPPPVPRVIITGTGFGAGPVQTPLGRGSAAARGQGDTLKGSVRAMWAAAPPGNRGEFGKATPAGGVTCGADVGEYEAWLECGFLTGMSNIIPAGICCKWLSSSQKPLASALACTPEVAVESKVAEGPGESEVWLVEWLAAWFPFLLEGCGLWPFGDSPKCTAGNMTLRPPDGGVRADCGIRPDMFRTGCGGDVGTGVRHGED